MLLLRRFNTLVVIYYICCISVQTDSRIDSRPLTFVFRLQAQCTTYAFIGALIFGNPLKREKNSKKKKKERKNYTFQVDIQISVEFKLLEAPLTLQKLFLKLQATLLKLPIREFKNRRWLRQRKRQFEIELCVSLSVSRLFQGDHVVQNRRTHFLLLCTNGFHVNAKNGRFTAPGSRCRQNLKYENFTSLFGRLRQKCSKKRAARGARLFFLIHLRACLHGGSAPRLT